ncbi:MAG TPA: catalase family protein, partial [Gammaproteobacteria bacterium]|nr:catalase family protein [Gammaproteobacteria bacterium]
VFRRDEAEQATRSVNNFLRVIEENKTTYVARGAHAKGHACVKAWFVVHASIRDELQHGVFSLPGRRYKSWIRFSNGRSGMKNNHDADRDAHGMAIKLFDVQGNQTGGLKNGTGTQDFLMHDHPVFFAANVEDYNRFVESENKILYFVSNINPFKWHLRELKHGLETLKPPPASPLHARYFSNTAYKLGPHNIKFSARPCSEKEHIPGQDKSDPDFLRKTMARELMNESACFEFTVQLQKPDKYMPIEDPSIEWRESDSPFIPVAAINIPVQEFDTSEQQSFCENLSFSPWNSLDAHRPIGELNRIRKQVYEASSRYRHEKNNTSIPANPDW